MQLVLSVPANDVCHLCAPVEWDAARPLPGPALGLPPAHVLSLTDAADPSYAQLRASSYLLEIRSYFVHSSIEIY